MARYEYKVVAIDSFDFRKNVEKAVIEWGNRGWRVVEVVHPRIGERFVLLERKKRRWRRNEKTALAPAPRPMRSELRRTPADN